MGVDLWQSRALQLVGKSLESATLLVDASRLIDARKAIDYYEDTSKQEAYLTAEFAALYADPESWNARPKSVYNLTKAVGDVLSTLYQDPVRRQFDDKSLSERWGDIKAFDATMQDVDLYTLLAGTVAVRPVWKVDARGKGSIRFAIYTSDQMDVTTKPDDPTTIDTLMLSWGVGANRVTHIWTDERFVESVDDTVTTDEANVYGYIPVVLFRNRRVLNGIFDTPARDLMKANLQVNKLVTDLNYTVAFQTHGQLVVKGAPQNFVVKSGPNTYLKIPAEQGADAYYINPGADVDKAVSAINLNLKMFLMSRRIPEDVIIAQAQGQSGVSIVAKQASLADYRKKRVLLFKDLEKELIRMTLDVEAVHNGKSRVDGDIDLTLDYKELKVPMDMTEQNEWSWRFQNKVSTPIDFLMSEDPDLTEEDAAKKYADVADFFAKRAVENMKNMMGGMKAGADGKPPMDKGTMPPDKGGMPNDKMMTDTGGGA